MQLNKHTIGILGGMGPAATANFMRLLIKHFNAFGIRTDSDFPRMVMLSLPLEEWDNTGSKDKAKVENQIKEGLYWLSRNDAEVIAIPCNTVHEFAKYNNHVVDIIDATLEDCQFFHAPIGVLCSRQTKESKLYERAPYKDSISYFADQDEIDNVIGNVMAGEFEEIGDLIDQGLLTGVKTVVLGCTELSLCSRTHNVYQVPIVDSTNSLARAVVKRTISL